MPDFKQVNLNLANEDVRKLDIMMAEDGYTNKSAWIRRELRLEFKRRYPQTESPAEQSQQYLPGRDQ